MCVGVQQLYLNIITIRIQGWQGDWLISFVVHNVTIKQVKKEMVAEGLYLQFLDPLLECRYLTQVDRYAGYALPVLGN